MKLVFCFLIGMLATATTKAQKLSQVCFTNGGVLGYFTVLTDQQIQIRLSPDGKIMEWGSEVKADRANYYAPKLQPFMGRIEYYGQDADSVYRNKVKNIGATYLTYFGAYEDANKRGKVKSIGSLSFDYFAIYDEKSLQGKIKSIGTLLLDYYRQYDNEAIRGKLKAIGSLPITYYSSFDDRFNAGKLKSIGLASYTWYSQYDRSSGALKSGNYRQVVSGITFILQ